MFLKLDVSGTGTLCKEEFKSAFIMLKEHNILPEEFSDQIIEQFFDTIDINKSDSINYTEFIAMFTNN